MPASKTITWNGVSSTTVPGLTIGPVKRSLIGTPRMPKITVPGRAGFISFSQPPGPRKIVAECFIEGDTSQDRRDNFEDLADWLDVSVESPLTISDTPGVYYMGVIEDCGDADEWREFGTFEIVWEVQPYSYDTEITEEEWSGAGTHSHSWNPNLKTLVYPIIEVRPNNGTLTGFELEVNQDTLNFSGNIADDQTVTINSIATVVLAGLNGDLELTGAYDPESLWMQGVSGQFPILIPDGTNEINFTKTGGTATNITITVSYRKTYRK